MHFKKIGWIVGVFFSAQVMASPATLWTAYQDAVAHDPLYQTQKATFSAAQQAAPIARADLLPQLSLSGQWSHTYQSANSLGDVDYNSNQYSINFSQMIFNFSALNNLRQAKKSVQAAATLFSAQGQDLLVRLVRAYLFVLQSRDLLKDTRSQKKFAKDFLTMTQKKYALKFATITEIDQAREQYELFRAQAVSADIQYQQSIENLSTLTAKSYHHFSHFCRQFPLLSPKPNAVSQWIVLAQKQNLSLRAAQLNAAAVAETIAAKKSDFLPNIAATSSYSDVNQLSSETSGATEEAIRSREVGLNASWNLVQGGLTIAEVNQASEYYAKAMAEMDQRYLETMANTRNAYNGVSAGVTRVRADFLAVQAGLSGLQHTRAGFKAGVQSIFDLLQAQNRLFEAQKQYIRDFYQYVTDTVLLKQMAGTLSPQDIHQLNHYLR